MEQTEKMQQTQQMQQANRVWQRVNPGLEPYPPQEAGETENFCCMGSAAEQDIEVVHGFIEEELADRQTYLAYAAAVPGGNARRLMRQLAAESGGHGRRLVGVYYLITGRCYRPMVSVGRVAVPCLRELLRQRYHAEACSGMNYRRAGEETVDECLAGIFRALSDDAFRHRRQLLTLLEGNLAV